MFCTFCYHGDCHVEQAKVCVCVCVCMYNVCSCANSIAISQTQSLKLFSKETTIKRETPTFPSLWFYSPPFFCFSYFSESIFFSVSFIPIFLHCPIHFSLFVPPASSLSVSAPAFKCPPLPSCTLWQQGEDRERGGERQRQIDRGRLLWRVRVYEVIPNKRRASSGLHIVAF